MFESTHSITMWWFELPLSPTVSFHSLGWIKVGHLPNSCKGKVLLSKLQWKCRSIWHQMLNHPLDVKAWSSYQNIHSHPIAEYHPYTWEHYSHFSNKLKKMYFPILNRICLSLNYWVWSQWPISTTMIDNLTIEISNALQ